MDKRRKDKKADKALRLYVEGYSLAEIGALLETSRQAIYDMLKRRNYTPRKRPDAKAQYFNGRKYTERNHGYFMATTRPRTLMHRDVWENTNGVIPPIHDVHHIDHDIANNDIKNLELLSKQEHARRFSSGSNQYVKKPKKW